MATKNLHESSSVVRHVWKPGLAGATPGSCQSVYSSTLSVKRRRRHHRMLVRPQGAVVMMKNVQMSCWRV